MVLVAMSQVVDRRMDREPNATTVYCPERRRWIQSVNTLRLLYRPTFRKCGQKQCMCCNEILPFLFWMIKASSFRSWHVYASSVWVCSRLRSLYGGPSKACNRWGSHFSSSFQLKEFKRVLDLSRWSGQCLAHPKPIWYQFAELGDIGLVGLSKRRTLNRFGNRFA